MLYVTTRTDRDAFTGYRAMTGELGPGGGQFLPRQMPFFGEEALKKVAERSFNQNVAHVLRLLYREKLTAWDVELVMGKRPLHLAELNSRTLAAEIWRNSELSFDELVQRMFRILVKEPEAKPSQWFVMSLRIALLFGIFGELMARGIVTADAPLDISVPSFDFQFPMAVWYAKHWGLPIGSIICCCNENNAPWTLLHQGEMRTDAMPYHTLTPACDQAVPAGLERLIYSTLGAGETRRYLAAAAEGSAYQLESVQRDLLRKGLFVSVVSQRRLSFMIPNIYRAGMWSPDPYTAMAYAGLEDHRAREGDTGRALVISEESPVHSVETLSELMGLPADALRRRLENK